MSSNEELVPLIKCVRCGQMKPPHATNKHLCVDCVHAEDNRVMYYRQHQGDWIAEAKEQGLAPWLQQPGETQWEYTIWVAYRDSYPGKKPTYMSVATQLGTSYSAVKKVAQRWSFPARMQLWMIETDRITMLQRRDEILDMNKEHVDMARRLRSKMSAAIDAIEPTILKPSEIASLMKVSADLERKARIDTIAQEDLKRELLVDDTNPELKKQPTKTGDLQSIIDVLSKAGVLNKGTVGVRETTTKEIIVRGDESINVAYEEVEE